MGRTLLVLVLLLFCTLAEAKGIFQARGLIADVSRSGNALTFRFRGDVSFGYASARDNDARRRWHDMHFQGIEIPVRVSASGQTVDTLQAALVQSMKTQRAVQFSLDDPTLAFSNRGQLVRVSGTRLYAQ